MTVWLAPGVPEMMVPAAGAIEVGVPVAALDVPRAPAAPLAVRRVDWRTAPLEITEPLRVVVRARRPQALLPLYGAFATLSALDVHSTSRALAAKRCKEGNPLLGPVAGYAPTFVAAKTAAVGAVILMTERLWRRNRAGAVVMMAVMTGTLAAIDVHNYRAGR
jgi:hypothetical protein